MKFRKRIRVVFLALIFLGMGMGESEFRCLAEEKEAVRVETVQKYISSEIPCELEAMQSPPEYAVLELKDDVSQDGNEKLLPILEVKEKYREWKEGFCFPITVTGYDSDIFLLGDAEIRAEEELSSYKKEFLKYLGLSEEFYQIDEIQWTGESYEKDGVLCRNALAKGRKLMRYADVRYGGNVRLLSEVREEKKEEMPIEVIENLKEEESELGLALPSSSEIIDHVAGQEEQDLSFLDKLARWFQEHLTVITISILFFLCIILILVFLFRSEKKKSQD